jgi:hypothetical protein
LILSGVFGHATFNCVSSFNSRCDYFDDARVKSAIDNTTGERWRISIRCHASWMVGAAANLLNHTDRHIRRPTGMKPLDGGDTLAHNPSIVLSCGPPGMYIDESKRLTRHGAGELELAGGTW